MPDKNVTVEDSQITFPGAVGNLPPWSGTSTLCSQQGTAHFAYQPKMSVQYSFVGTAIYTRILRSNVTGTYTVSVDNGTPILFDGYAAEGTCDVQFGQTGLTFQQHTVNVTMVGRSPQNTDPNLSDDSYLEVDAFIYTTPDLSTTSSASATASGAHTSSTGTVAQKSNTSTIIGVVVAVVGALIIAIVILLLMRRSRRQKGDRPTSVLGDYGAPPHAPQGYMTEPLNHQGTINAYNVPSAYSAYNNKNHSAPVSYNPPSSNVPSSYNPYNPSHGRTNSDNPIPPSGIPSGAAAAEPRRPKGAPPPNVPQPSAQSGALSGDLLQNLAAEVAALINAQNQGQQAQTSYGASTSAGSSADREEAPPEYEPPPPSGSQAMQYPPSGKR